MTDQLQKSGAEKALMREMGLTEQNIDRRKKIVGLGPEDSKRIASIKDIVQKNVDELTSTFFAYLSGLEEAKTLLGNRDLLERARTLKKEHLLDMVRGEYSAEYVEQRLRLAVIYSKAGLEPLPFLGAFHNLLRSLGALVMKQPERNPLEAFENFMSLKKVAFMDISIIVDLLVSERERTIRQQQEAIRELSTPVLQIRDRMLLVPIIGVIDTQRARLITESLLSSIRANRARVVVMDVTGVATVDSRVAAHLMQTIMAARLMGATAIVTGLSSEVAQSLAALGIDLDKFNTVGDLQGGLETAERLVGYRLVKETEDNGVHVP
jgi:rsbT co-antagonist protein RsbR